MNTWQHMCEQIIRGNGETQLLLKTREAADLYTSRINAEYGAGSVKVVETTMTGDDQETIIPAFAVTAAK